MSSPRTQAARRTRISELLEETSIRSQEELRSRLASEGFDVTQATVSRDLLELGAVKAVDGQGGIAYRLPEDSAGTRQGRGQGARAAGVHRAARAFQDLVVSVDHSANIVVVRTPPGGAQYLASTIDRSHWDSVLGTVAGDDTVFLVTRDARGGASVAAEILALAQARGDSRMTGTAGASARRGGSR